MVLICFENFENFSKENFSIYQKCPFQGQLSLASYAQNSVAGELNQEKTFVLRDHHFQG